LGVAFPQDEGMTRSAKLEQFTSNVIARLKVSRASSVVGPSTPSRASGARRPRLSLPHA
jgi:hypothetical protein